MAPKFLVSVIPSSKRYVWFSFSLYVFEIKSSRDISDTGDRIATAPWWFLLLYLLNFSLGTNENFILWRIRGTYYRVLRTFGLVKITSRYSGYGLYKRELIEELKIHNLEEPSLRILLPLTTNNIKYIPYKHLEREYGKSSYNLYLYIKEALKTIIRNSTKIPSLAAKLALIFTIFSIFLIPITIILKLLFWQSLGPGIASIIILILLSNSGILLFISLLLDR